MKKIYEEPDFETVSFELSDILDGKVIHSSFESGGQNSGWDFSSGNDDWEEWDDF